MYDDARLTVHVRMVASEENHMGAIRKMTYVGRRGSQMWSDGGGRVEGGYRVGGVEVGGECRVKGVPGDGRGMRRGRWVEGAGVGGR